jgi:uncharacterized OsmC-like protein
MSNVKESTVVNGVDTDALKDALHAFRKDADLGRFHFRVRNRWEGGTHNRSKLPDYYGAHEEHEHKGEAFELACDEPKPLLGGDEYPNPVEYLLHALAGCLTTTMVCHAAARGIEVRSVESVLEGDIDVRGFLGIADDVPRGYQEIRVTLKVDSDAPAETLAELAKYSPVYNTLTNPLAVQVHVEKT